ncbi:MAG: hypothetical protein FK732_01320, partial [Asgard group archaeon]|nr:hypothetical protein [Asgard group archaeon]
MENRISKVTSLIKNFELFLNLAKTTFTEPDLKISDDIELLLKQILVKQTKQHDHLIDAMTAKRVPIITPKPVVEERVTPVTQVTPHTPVPTKTLEEVTQIVEKEEIIPTIKPRFEEAEPSIEADFERKRTVYSRFEKNLVQYWFFYLAILFLSVGVIVTVVFVVIEIESVTQQLTIIYCIGFAILLIGELIAILSRRRKKRKEEKMEIEVEDEGRFPLPAFGTVIVFIGLLVIYAAGIIGFGSPVPRSVFIYISFGVALLAIVLGVINDSEMITLTGFIPTIAIVVVDLSWEGAPALNEAVVFIALTIPIIIAAVTAIFFKKWWGAAVMVTVLPVILCLPMVSTKMGLEFIPLMLIPLMALLISRFDKGNIPFTHKKIIVVLSQLLPIVGLTVISFPAINFSDTEPLWARIYPVEIIIATLIVLGISFFYQFIQEKYLDIKSKVCIFYHVGQGLVGTISIIMVVLNRDSFNGFIYSIIYFSFFFIVGVLGILKVFRERLTLVGTIVSFALAEIHAIFMFTLINVSPELKLGIQFATAIIFTLLAIMTIAFSKRLNVSEYLFSSWIIISAINNMIFIFIQKANYWFIFGSLGLFLILPLLSIEPNKGVPNYISQVSLGILSITMILANLGNPYNYIFSIIFFVAFFILGIFSTIFKNYFTLIGTIISFAIAEAHAILILSLFDMTSYFKLIVYFVVGISFIILALLAIALTKKLEVSKQVYTTWVIFAVINITILAFIQKLSTWYILGALLIFLILPALNIKPNVDIPYYIGLGSIGVLTSVLAGLNHASSINYIFIVICFGVFFIIGILGLIKKLENYYTLPGTLVSFGFAEVLAILGMIFLNTSTPAQYAIYFIIAISFLVLALFAIILSKVFEVSKYIYIGWIGASLVNSLLLLLMNRVGIWYAFALVLLFFAVTAIELEPNTGIGSIVGKCSVGILSIIMITTNLLDPFNYIYNVVFYSLFFILGTLGLIKVLKKQFSLTGTLISFGFAEVLVILSMILQSTATTGQISIYFIMAISFLVISLLALFLVKFLEVSEYLYLGFIGASLVNSLLLLLMNKVDSWFAFAMLILFFAVTAIELEPNTGRNHIIGKCVVGVLSIVMVSVSFSDPNNFIYSGVFFGLFFIIGVVGLLNILRKY